MAATNKNLSAMVEGGDFREDLYYRLNVVKIELPSLAERKEDIPLLVEHFIHRFNLKMNKRIHSAAPEVMELFIRYTFPGNIRELENAIEHAFVLCQAAQIKLDHLPNELVAKAKEAARPASIPNDPLKMAEAQTILRVLEKHGGNRKAAAEELGISAATLWRKRKKMGI